MSDNQIRTVVVRGSASGFSQDVELGPHRLRADEPISLGGTDLGPNPYDLLAAALGTCKSMTVGAYARRKGWPVTGVTVRLQHSKIHAVDCEECETKEGKIDQIEVVLELAGSLTEEQRTRLLEIADRCPVHKTLTSEIRIRTRLE
jgi:putative redox protein